MIPHDDSREEVVMLIVRLVAFALTLVLIASSCKSETVPPSQSALVRLLRSDDGTISLEISRADRAPKAIEVEITADGDSVILEDAEPLPHLALDTVRLNMLGTNRAVLFVSDKRPVLLPRTGEVARFRARSAGGGAPSGRLSLSRVLVVDENGARIEVEIGSPVSLR